MDLRNLTLFCDVARLGSFAAAARAHGCDPSAVSRAVAGLETELGARLFHRSTRSLALTEAGRLFLTAAQDAVDGIEGARARLSEAGDAVTGTLRLGASVSFGQIVIVPLLAEIRARFADLSVELILSDDNADLAAERIDLAVRLAPRVQADVICTRLMPTRYHVAATPSWIDAHGRPDRPQALGELDCLRLTLSPFSDRWLFRRGAGDPVIEVPVKGNLSFSNPRAMADAMLAGLGPALVPDWLVSGPLASGGAIDLFADHEVTATSFDTAAWLIYPSRAHLPLKTRAMIAFLRERAARGLHPEPMSRR
jgi:DNA-binding transcriptional LysR family regulator